MNYKKLNEHDRHEENPFVERTLEEMKTVKKHQLIRPAGSGREEIQMIVDKRGEVTGHTAFMRYVEVDEQQFAKLYISQLVTFWELSKPGMRVLTYIISILKPKQDSVIIRTDKALEYTGYKQANMINSGLADLIERGLIARTKYADEFYINPLVIFNGDRVTWAKTYVKKDSLKEITDEMNGRDWHEKGAASPQNNAGALPPAPPLGLSQGGPSESEP